MRPFLAIFRRAVPLVLAALLLLPGVLFAANAGEPMLLPVDPVPLTVDGGPTRISHFSIEIADDAVERGRGLMFREQMPDDRGMLFVFENTKRVAFWMKDTPMPLDLIFIGEDGRVQAVLQGQPFSTTPLAPPGPIRFVLEVKAGVAQMAGIRPYVRIHHPEIDAIAGS